MLAAPTRVLLRLTVAAALVAAAPLVRAQTITLPALGTFYRQRPIRPTGQQPHWVSQADCLAKDVISFTISMTGYQTQTLEVWASDQSVDCTPTNERMPGGSAQCWLVYRAPATATPTRVDISAVDLVARNTPDTTTPIGYPEACLNSSSPAGAALTLSFFLTNGAGIISTTQLWKDIGYDVAAPTAATNLSAGAGETRLHLSWSDAADSDIRGYQFYCDPPPGSVLPDGGLKTASGPPLGTLDTGSGGTFFGTGGNIGIAGSLFGSGGDLGIGGSLLGSGGSLLGAGGGSLINAGGAFFETGGAGGTAGTTGTGTTATPQTVANCSSSSVLQPGVSPISPTNLGSYSCGSVSGIIANSGTVGGLVNNFNYVVAIAAYDQVGNVGVLSQNTCGTPVNVTDFFELYKQAGGKAGGGICSVSFTENPARTGIVFVGSVLALMGAARRIRRRRG